MGRPHPIELKGHPACLLIQATRKESERKPFLRPLERSRGKRLTSLTTPSDTRPPSTTFHASISVETIIECARPPSETNWSFVPSTVFERSRCREIWPNTTDLWAYLVRLDVSPEVCTPASHILVHPRTIRGKYCSVDDKRRGPQRSNRLPDERIVQSFLVW